MDQILGDLGGWGSLTASGVVLIAVILIFRGNLVPRLYYDEMRDSRDRLQTALDKSNETVIELLKQQAVLLEAADTTKRVIEALPPPSAQGG